jgi:putative thioredoxin
MNQTRRVYDVTDTTFSQDVIERSKQTTVLVDFWAPWCGPCRMLGPTLERLANEPDSNFVLAKINVDHNGRTAQQYGVQGIPAVKAFRDGRLVDGFVGALPEPNVRAFLKRVAPTATGQVRQDGAKFLAEGKWAAAEAAFRQTLNHGPDLVARLGLARALLRQGNGCAAQEQLANFPASPQYQDAQQLLPLARFLCAATKRQLPSTSALDRSYQQAASELSRGEMSGALYHLLGIQRTDKSYRDGEAKSVMLGIFALLGAQDPVVQNYRQQLASLLF